MPWPFVGRTEQLDRIHKVFNESRPDPVMLVGPPGMGRSRLLTEALARAPLSQDDAVLRLKPAGPAPFAALRGLLPAGFIFTSSPDHDVTGAADELAGRLAGRRPVFTFDDAHRADPHTLRVLRHLRRTHGALVLVTFTGTGPDPLDCLRYEPGTRTLRLPPLSKDEVARILAEALDRPVRPATAAALHAATGGNPGRLHNMVTAR
jgi:predicted ATPase